MEMNELLSLTKANDQNVLNSKTFARIAKEFDLNNKKVLDIGCGPGSYLQRFGEGSVGITTDPSEVEIGKAIGRDIRLGNAEKLSESLSAEDKFDVIWCNNIFEHLLSPHGFLVRLKEFSGKDTLIILGTPLIPKITSLTKLKRFRGALASPHINFFTQKTYELTVKYAGWNLKKISPFYFGVNILDKMLRPIAPHLYLIAKNNHDYQYPPKKIKEWEDDPLYKPLIGIMNGL